MNKEEIKETLKNHRNIQTHLWTGMLVTISGTLSLLQNFDGWLNKVLFIIGNLLFIFLFSIYLDKNEQILKLTRKMEDKE